MLEFLFIPALENLSCSTKVTSSMLSLTSEKNAPLFTVLYSRDEQENILAFMSTFSSMFCTCTVIVHYFAFMQNLLLV